MGLTTFGSIMNFAADMFRIGEESLNAAVQSTSNPTLKKTLQHLLEEQHKNKFLMERARREHVTEMMLEPIAGLRQEDYEMNATLPDPLSDADLLRLAIVLEQKEMKFLRDCSAKIPLPEAAAILRKVIRKKEENLEQLKGMSS